jgi:hypothetical protein
MLQAVATTAAPITITTTAATISNRQAWLDSVRARAGVLKPIVGTAIATQPTIDVVQQGGDGGGGGVLPTKKWGGLMIGGVVVGGLLVGTLIFSLVRK